MSTWKIKINDYAEQWGESCEDITFIWGKLDDELNPLTIEFDDDFGGTEGIPFRGYSETRIYFPICYDGSEWVGSVPVSVYSTDEKPRHFGG